MKRLASLILLSVCYAAVADVATIRWNVETSNPFPQPLNLLQGETVILQPRYLLNAAPLPLSDVYEVVLRYRSTDMADGYYYAVTGSVANATNGVCSVEWTPECAGHTNAYVYTIAAKHVTGTTMRAFGMIKVARAVQGVATNQPRAITTTFDWASVEHLNVVSAPFLSEADILLVWNAIVAQSNVVTILSTGKVDRGEWLSTNATLRAAIDAIEGGGSGGGSGGPTTLSGDASGPSTNTTVVALQGVPVTTMSPGDGEHGYGLTFDAPSGALVLSPVAAEVGGVYSNVILVTGTNNRYSVTTDQAGLYRTMRPGNIPSFVANVDGTEVAQIDLFGLTMRYGTLSLLNSNLQANVRTYDGSVAQPAYSWISDPTLGRYRISHNGGNGEAYAAAGTSVWFWAADGIHLQPGTFLFGGEWADLPDYRLWQEDSNAVLTHVTQTGNPHSTTAADAGAIDSQGGQFYTSPGYFFQFGSAVYVRRTDNGDLALAGTPNGADYEVTVSDLRTSYTNAWVSQFVPKTVPSSPTVTVMRAYGPQIAIVVTNPTCKLTFSGDWTTGVVGHVVIDLIPGTNAVSLDTNVVSGTITNSTMSTIEVYKPWSRSMWRVLRQW